MNTSAIYHHCGDHWCYAFDDTTLHIRIRTAASDIDRVEIVCGDPYEWQPGKEGYEWASDLYPMRKVGTNGVHDFWEFLFEPPYRRLKYWFILHKGRASVEYGEKGVVTAVDRHNTWNTFIYPYIQPTEVYRAPEWVGETVWYQIFPERYHNGNPALNPPGTKEWQYGEVTNKEYYGGDLAGITAKLDHIADLGFNGIYLTPIFQSPSVHKYDTGDYLKIDPAFGTEEDLRTLVAECHRRGIRIILDAVFNHSGTTFAPWADVLEKGEASRFRDWFAIRDFPLFGVNEDGSPRADDGDSHRANFETFAFTTGMPKLNTANPEVREYLLKVADYWIRECDIDGWRLDVANEVTHDFWREFRRVVKAAKPDAYIVGEIWHHSIDWLRGDQYDAIMNYHFGQAITEFLKGTAEIPDARALAHRAETLEKSYPLPVIRAGFNLLDSHDTARLIHRLDGNLSAARIAWLILALLPGSPCFYYGSEYAVTGAHDPDCRRCMPWDTAHQDRSQYEFLKAVIALRRENAALVNRGRREWLTNPKLPDVFGFRISAGAAGEDESDAAYGRLRPENGYRGAKSLTVFVNRGKKPVSGARLAKAFGKAAECPEFAELGSEGYAWALG